MGVHNLMKHIKSSFTQIPLDSKLRSGILKFIGVDYAHFLHQCVSSKNGIEQNAYLINSTILHYVDCVCNLFQNDNYITLFLAIDGYPPVPKNKIKYYTEKRENIYKLINIQKLIQVSIKTLQEKLAPHINLITNFNLNVSERGEGEIQLIKYANNKKLSANPLFRNVIISLDSDILAMMVFLKNPNIILVTPNFKTNVGFIYDLNILTNKLNLNYTQLINYVLLHFIYFGSDYNYGFMNNNNYEEDFKTIIQLAAVDFKYINFYDTLEIAKAYTVINNNDDSKNRELFQNALRAITYYLSIGENKDILINKNKPLYISS